MRSWCFINQFCKQVLWSFIATQVKKKSKVPVITNIKFANVSVGVYYVTRSHLHTHDWPREAQTYAMPPNFPNGAINYVVYFKSSFSSVRKGGLELPASYGLSTYCSGDWVSNYCMCAKINVLQINEDFSNLNSSINGTYKNV